MYDISVSVTIYSRKYDVTLKTINSFIVFRENMRAYTEFDIQFAAYHKHQLLYCETTTY